MMDPWTNSNNHNFLNNDPILEILNPADSSVNFYPRNAIETSVQITANRELAKIYTPL